jgi:hypothetical protein
VGPDVDVVWNGVLTVACGCFVWWIKSQKSEFQNIYDMIGEIKRRVADTREDMAKIYVTKEDSERDREEVMRRFDKIEEKLDALIINTRG